MPNSSNELTEAVENEKKTKRDKNVTNKQEHSFSFKSDLLIFLLRKIILILGSISVISGLNPRSINTIMVNLA